VTDSDLAPRHRHDLKQVELADLGHADHRWLGFLVEMNYVQNGRIGRRSVLAVQHVERFRDRSHRSQRDSIGQLLEDFIDASRWWEKLYPLGTDTRLGQLRQNFAHGWGSARRCRASIFRQRSLQ